MRAVMTSAENAEPLDPPRKVRTWQLALVFVVAGSLLGAVLTALLYVPVSHPIQGSIAAATYWPADGSYKGFDHQTYPARALVHIEWTETGLSSTVTSPVMFTVYPENGGDGCYAVSSGGSCMCISNGGPYQFQVSGEVGTGESDAGSYAVPGLTSA